MRLVTSVFIALGIVLVAFVGYFIYSMSQMVGGAGGIKAYEYPVTKYELEKAINFVVNNDKNIYRDSTRTYKTYDSATKVITYSADSVKGSAKETDYYNDGIGYLTLHVSRLGLSYKYVIRYYADSAYWDTSKTAEIFIVYANGYSAGHSKISRELKNEITGLFESEFLTKLDKQLGKTHVVDPD